MFKQCRKVLFSYSFHYSTLIKFEHFNLDFLKLWANLCNDLKKLPNLNCIVKLTSLLRCFKVLHWYFLIVNPVITVRYSKIFSTHNSKCILYTFVYHLFRVLISMAIYIKNLVEYDKTKWFWQQTLSKKMEILIRSFISDDYYK